MFRSHTFSDVITHIVGRAESPVNFTSGNILCLAKLRAYMLDNEPPLRKKKHLLNHILYLDAKYAAKKSCKKEKKVTKTF